MNEPHIESETNPSTAAEWTDQIVALRRQITLQLLALIVISGTLTVYLGYQSHITGKAIDVVQPQAVQTVKALQQNRPTIDKFVRQLIVYGQSHPDFQPVLKKYGIPLTLSALTNSVPEK